jgi:hypothetical protein
VRSVSTKSPCTPERMRLTAGMRDLEVLGASPCASSCGTHRERLLFFVATNIERYPPQAGLDSTYFATDHGNHDATLRPRCHCRS